MRGFAPVSANLYPVRCVCDQWLRIVPRPLESIYRTPLTSITVSPGNSRSLSCSSGAEAIVSEPFSRRIAVEPVAPASRTTASSSILWILLRILACPQRIAARSWSVLAHQKGLWSGLRHFQLLKPARNRACQRRLPSRADGPPAAVRGQRVPLLFPPGSEEPSSSVCLIRPGALRYNRSPDAPSGFHRKRAIRVGCGRALFEPLKTARHAADH